MKTRRCPGIVPSPQGPEKKEKRKKREQRRERLPFADSYSSRRGRRSGDDFVDEM